MANTAVNGLSNEAYEGDSKRRPTLSTVSAAVATYATSGDTEVPQHDQGGKNNRTMAMDEIELQTKNNYQVLCQCEEKGFTCRCAAKSQGFQQRISWQHWNKCKTVSIALLVVLVCAWFVVYVTLSQLKAI